MEEALTAVASLKLGQLKDPRVIVKDSGALSWDALPLKTMSSKAQRMNIWVERITGVDGSLDLGTLTSLLENR